MPLEFNIYNNENVWQITFEDVNEGAVALGHRGVIYVDDPDEHK